MGAQRSQRVEEHTLYSQGLVCNDISVENDVLDTNDAENHIYMSRMNNQVIAN